MVYLLHFSQKYKHAAHYMGSTDDLDRRLTQHREGRGARLVQVIRQAGLDFELARTWPGGRLLERHLKDTWHGAVRLCPICSGEAAMRRAAATITTIADDDLPF